MTTISTEHCVVRGCRVRGEHWAACDDDDCRGCRPRRADHGQLCAHHLGGTRRHLVDLVSLYALAGYMLEKPVTGPSERSGSADPPLPVSLEVLNLRQRGGMVATLESWERDWRELRGDEPPRPRGSDQVTLAGVVAWLDGHAEWAANHHPAIDEFVAEVNTLWSTARNVLGLVDRPMRSDVPCFSCGEQDLERRYGPTGLADHWVCARCGREYAPGEYARATAQIVDSQPATAVEMQRRFDVRGNIFRMWVSRGTLLPVGADLSGKPLYDPLAVSELVRNYRARPRVG